MRHPNPSSFRWRSREGREAPAKEMPARNHRSAGPQPPCRLPGGLWAAGQPQVLGPACVVWTAEEVGSLCPRWHQESPEPLGE